MTSIQLSCVAPAMEAAKLLLKIAALDYSRSQIWNANLALLGLTVARLALICASLVLRANRLTSRVQSTSHSVYPASIPTGPPDRTASAAISSLTMSWPADPPTTLGSRLLLCVVRRRQTNPTQALRTTSNHSPLHSPSSPPPLNRYARSRRRVRWRGLVRLRRYCQRGN